MFSLNDEHVVLQPVSVDENEKPYVVPGEQHAKNDGVVLVKAYSPVAFHNMAH